MALIERLDDRTLVELHRAGDADAFRQIVLRHHRSLYANAQRRLGDPVLAEDAVQEAFLRAFRNLDRFDGDYHLDAWLHRIVTNACHDIGRRRGRDVRLFDRACAAVDVDAPPADEALDLAGDDQVTAALDRLPEAYRDVLLLRFVDELAYPDVADKVGISEENARARVSRARKLLRKMLSGTGALAVWAMTPLRRANDVQVHGTETAAEVAGNVHHLTNLASAAAPAVHSGAAVTSALAQAGPAVANLASVAAPAGPAVKAAVAAGLAAAVAIPTGLAVDRAHDRPVPHAAAPMADQEKAVASPADPVRIEQRGRGSAVASSATPPTEADVPAATGEPTGGAAATSPPDSTTTTTPERPPAPERPSVGERPFQPSPGPAPQPPAQPVPGPLGVLRGEKLTASEAGPRAVELKGPIAITIGARAVGGTVSGKVDVGDPDPKDPAAPRSVAGTLVLRFDDGSVRELRLAGTAVVTGEGPEQTFDLDTRFVLEGAADLGLSDQGTTTGVLHRRDGSASLDLELPGAAPSTSG